MGKMFLEIHYLGIQGRGKCHKVKHLKIIFLNFLTANLESLVNFLQEYSFVTHIGLVDFELQAFLLWRLSPNIFCLNDLDLWAVYFTKINIVREQKKNL